MYRALGTGIAASTLKLAYLFSFCAFGLVIFAAVRMRTIAMHLGRSPSGWAVYGLLVPGVSYLHLRHLRRASPLGCAAYCRLIVTDGVSTGALVQRGVTWEVAVRCLDGEDRLFGATPQDRRSEGDIEDTKRGDPFEGILWFWDGDGLRACLSPGTSFEVRDAARGRGARARNVFLRGEVVEILPTPRWEDARLP